MVDDEVTTLKRELEALKLQLEQERKKNATVQGEGDTKQEQPTPRDESSKAKRPGGGDKKSAAASASYSKEPRVYVQHAAVGARRGKWWLRDRQVLSRATPHEDDGATLKVRETWVWSGRTVVLDKIVRLDEEKQEEERADVDQTRDEELEVEEKEPDGVPTSPVEVLELTAGVAASLSAQQSDEAETSEAVRGEAVDSKEVAPLSPAKADDEVRESSATEISDTM